MFNHHLFERSRLRNGALASAAVVALVAGGALGEGALATHPSAVAAQLPTADLAAHALPSFAPLIERVKPAVVSVKVKIVDRATRAIKAARASNSAICRPRSRSSSNSSAIRTTRPPVRVDRLGRGLGILHFVRRLYRHQQPRGAERQVGHRDDGRRQGPGRQGRRDRPEDGSGAVEGRSAGQLSLCGLRQ